MQIRHPRDDGDGGPGIAIDVNGETVLPDADGVYDIGGASAWLEDYATANGTAPDALLVATTDTCDAVKTDGEVCGRDLPCPYHGEDADA